MSKPSRGGPKYAAGKKKAKKRPEPLVEASTPSTQVPEDSGQAGGRPEAAQKAAGTVVQFRPRTGMRPVAARAASSARAFQQVVDYSYVYTDLKIIGGLAAALLGGLVVLALAIH